MAKPKPKTPAAIARRTVTLSNAEVIALNDALERIAGSTYAGTLTWRIALLLRLLRPMREALVEALKNPDAFEKARIALCEEHAEKNAKGQALREGGSYKIADKSAFETALAELQKSHGLPDKQTENKALLAEKIEVADLPILDAGMIPENWTPDVLAALLPICSAL